MLAPVCASGGVPVDLPGVVADGTGAAGVVGGVLVIGGAAVAGVVGVAVGGVVVVVVVLVRETLTTSWSRMVKVLVF